MQVLGQNTNGAHDRLANIKVFGSVNDAVDYEVKFPAQHLVQRLVLSRLGNVVPGQDQLSIGALEHCEGSSKKKRNHINFKLLWSTCGLQTERFYTLFFLFLIYFNLYYEIWVVGGGTAVARLVKCLPVVKVIHIWVFATYHNLTVSPAILVILHPLSVVIQIKGRKAKKKIFKKNKFL